MSKKYRILIKEASKPEKEIEISTEDLEKAIEQYSRNRHVERWEIVETVDIDKPNMLFG
jgi:hypothetical protein